MVGWLPCAFTAGTLANGFMISFVNSPTITASLLLSEPLQRCSRFLSSRGPAQPLQVARSTPYHSASKLLYI